MGVPVKTIADALGMLGDVRAVEPLIKVLDGKARYYDWDILKAAAEALGKLGDPKAVQPLVKVLEHSDWQVRKCAAISLLSITKQNKTFNTSADIKKLIQSPHADISKKGHMDSSVSCEESGGSHTDTGIGIDVNDF